MAEEESTALRQFEDAFDAIRRDANSALEQLSYKDKKTLHHYTDAVGFQKIVESGCFWATDTRYLSDASELLYALDVVARVAKEMAGENAKRSSWSRELLSHIQDAAWPGPVDIYDVYVACFSEEPDVLSQWRAYAKDGEGYAVGVEYDTGFHVLDCKDNVRLLKVIYDESDQKNLLRPWLERIVSALDGFSTGRESNEIEKNQAIFGAFVTLKLVVSELAVAMKNPGFVEEAEWRLVLTSFAMGMGGAPTKFRPSRFGLTPYVEVRTGTKLPLRIVTRGPKLASQASHMAVFRFLSQLDFALMGDGAVALQKSKIAYR